MLWLPLQSIPEEDSQGIRHYEWCHIYQLVPKCYAGVIFKDYTMLTMNFRYICMLYYADIKDNYIFFMVFAIFSQLISIMIHGDYKTSLFGLVN